MTGKRTELDAADGAARTALDRAHLERMTFGDQPLAREVLELFLGQAQTLMAGLDRAPPAAVAAAAHRLKGSARGIGAWGVAAAAEAVEQAASTRPEALAAALAALGRAVDDAKAAIAALLQGA